MRHFLKFLRGQSAVEYMALVVFVMVGILIGGPYVVRSLNSNFKSAEEGSMTSERERILQADSSGNLLNCSCEEFKDGGCGSGSHAREKLFTKTCTPQGCPGSTSEFRDDPTNTCCEAEEKVTGLCGEGCPLVKQMKWKKKCGSPGPGVDIFECRDTPSCIIDCEPLPPTNNLGWCDPLKYNENLSSSTIVAVDHDQCLTDPNMKCKMRCDQNSTATGSVCIQHCPNGKCENGIDFPDLGENKTNCPNDCGGQQWCPPSFIGQSANFWDIHFWVAPATDSSTLVGEVGIFKKSVDFPYVGTYQISMRVDDGATVAIDGNIVYTFSRCSMCAPQAGLGTFEILNPGVREVTVNVWNKDNGWYSWAKNPVGFGLQILSPYLPPNGFAITLEDTGSDSGWKSTVYCSKGTEWDCAVRKCAEPFDCADGVCRNDCPQNCSGPPPDLY